MWLSQANVAVVSKKSYGNRISKANIEPEYLILLFNILPNWIFPIRGDLNGPFHLRRRFYFYTLNNRDDIHPNQTPPYMPNLHIVT